MKLASVMLVDDETGFVETMTRRLEKRELDVITANSGDEALEKLDGSDLVDVVVLDVKMPGMDGIETLKRIKAELPLVEVIMLTGHACVDDGIEGMKRGAFDYLSKPCEIELLLAKIMQAKAKKTAHEQKILEAQAREIVLRRGD